MPLSRKNSLFLLKNEEKYFREYLHKFSLIFFSYSDPAEKQSKNLVIGEILIEIFNSLNVSEKEDTSHLITKPYSSWTGDKIDFIISWIFVTNLRKNTILLLRKVSITYERFFFEKFKSLNYN